MKYSLIFTTAFLVAVATLGSKYAFETTNMLGTTVIMAKTTGKAILAPQDLTTKQQKLINLAYNKAKEAGLKDPEILQMIVLQETKAGALKSYKVAGQEFGLKTNERYYGVTQIKSAAARDVMKAFPELWKKYEFHTQLEEELIANLILNDEFNLDIASKYLKILNTQYGYSGERLILAYNQGPGGAKNVDDVHGHFYVKGAKRFEQPLKNGKTSF